MTPQRPDLPVVRRQRLLDALAAPGARLVVVTGPAGSGKTVLVRDWLATAGTPVAWLSLDASHGDPEHFLDALIGTLEGLAPGLREATWPSEPGERSADQATERAVAHLGTAPGGVIVLDDLHAIDRTPTARRLGQLVDAAPRNLRVVVCSRTDPPLPLHRYRLAGDLVELREADLRFDADEAARFFARFPHLHLERHHVERLAERTEGWVAGLQFAALSLVGRTDTDAFVDRFAGSDRHVADFLLDEVLDRQPDHVRDFLLATSVLDRFCAHLCEHVTGRPDAAALLRRIEHDHLFLQPLDDDREWFRYHHLFGQLLRRELRVTRPELERTGHRRAGAWFAGHGEPGRAVGHLLDAGDHDAAFALLRRHLRELLTAGRHETLRGWLRRFPAAFVMDGPARQLLFTWAFGRAGDLDRARTVAASARAADGAGDGVSIAPHLDVVDVAVAAARGDPETAVSLGEATWERRGESAAGAAAPAELAAAVEELWGYLPLAMARACALLDDRAGVRRWARVMRRDGPRLPSDLVGVLGAEAWVEARRGRLRTAAELAGQALVVGTEQGRGARRALIGARAALARVHRERNELDQAVTVLEPHVESAAREGMVAIAVMGEAELARVECCRGEPDRALDRVLRVRREREADGMPPFLAGVVDRAECRVRLHAGDVERARDLIAEMAPAAGRRLLEARCALAEGRDDELESLLADLRSADGPPRLEAVALSARALAEAGDRTGARRLLGEVAEQAAREGAVRTFLDEGFDIGELARTEACAGAGPPPAMVNRRLVEPLSERELSVLRYLPSRLSNREIGAELYVSLNTVKSHLKTIYRKLDVERRDDAVRRARQLGLI
ncbi:MAG TPA: LuxR C-terminal-related transcriptional regulator [Acidimicrobiales bacterium]